MLDPGRLDRESVRLTLSDGAGLVERIHTYVLHRIGLPFLASSDGSPQCLGQNIGRAWSSPQRGPSSLHAGHGGHTALSAWWHYLLVRWKHVCVGAVKVVEVGNWRIDWPR